MIPSPNLFVTSKIQGYAVMMMTQGLVLMSTFRMEHLLTFIIIEKTNILFSFSGLHHSRLNETEFQGSRAVVP